MLPCSCQLSIIVLDDASLPESASVLGRSWAVAAYAGQGNIVQHACFAVYRAREEGTMSTCSKTDYVYMALAVSAPDECKPATPSNIVSM